MAVFEPRSSVGYVAPRVLAYPSGWSRLKDKEREFQQAENERLLYVAATRAGTCLIVARREKKPKENPWHSLTEDLADREIHQDPGPQARPTRPEISITTQEIEDAETSIARRWDAVRRRSYNTEAIKQAALSGTESKSALDDVLALALAAPADGESVRDTYAGEHGVEWGEDIHRLLETAMRDPGAKLEHLARSLTRERDGDDERVSALLDCVRAVQQSAIWKRARQQTKFCRDSAHGDRFRKRSRGWPGDDQTWRNRPGVLGKRWMGHRRLQDRPRGTTIDTQTRQVLRSASRKLCRHVADAHRGGRSRGGSSFYSGKSL